MKNIIAIICLSLFSLTGFSQTKTPAKAAPKATNNAAQPATSKPNGTATATEKVTKPAGAEGNGAAPEANPIDQSKAIASDLVISLMKSECKQIDKDQLSNISSMLSNASNNDELFNAIRMLIELAPAECYKSGNTEGGRQLTGNFNSDLDLAGFNSLLLKWEMLLAPSCFDAAWKTNEAKWKKQIQGIK